MKQLKDPIYGYIGIDDNIFDLIIDTPEFQRLRGVTQTSYAPLYASAVHNRFIHSLGVYHLGSIFSNSIKESPDEKDLKDKYLPIFNYACLLHDVGHAPFSHTGENFFLDPDGSRKKLHDVIIELTKDEELKEEISRKDYKAAPHELMSVIVSLKSFDNLFSDDKERGFFARSILGYQYIVGIDTEKSFLNCLISVLNSSIIDVDKLDYLIRDAYITGYDTVSIDYNRLLNSIRIIKKEDLYKVVYSQASISVIEDVIYAHDSEKKWIQNHPIVQYDSFLLQHAIEVLNNKYKDLFSFDALTPNGININGEYKASLINDGDILFLMKNTMNDSLIKEYFVRNNRRHPLWKSEAEYKAIFNTVFTKQTYEIIEDRINKLVKYLSTTNSSIEMNQSAFDGLEKDIEATKRECEKVSEEQKYNYEINLKEKEKFLQLLACFKKFAEDQKIDFDFVVLTPNRFNSGFGKVDFENIEILFSTLKTTHSFRDVATSLYANKSEREKYFYIYYKRNNRDDKIDIPKLVRLLNDYSSSEAFD